MNETTNLKLKKPAGNEYISVGIINENMDIIDAGMKEISDSVDAPEFDASGSVDGITGKTTLLASFVSKMPLIKFMRNVKAGFKLVSFVGDIVNNCVTDNANLPLSAAQGKKLMDLYTVLNTKITDFDSRIHIDDTTTIANLSAQIKTGFQCVYLKSANLKPNYGHGVILELNNASGLYAIRIISWDDDTPNIGMYYGIKLSPSTLIKDVSYFSLQVNR